MSAAQQAERLKLAAGAAELGIQLEGWQLDALQKLLDEVQAANARFNLTAIRDRGDMLVKHVLDSLTLQRHLPLAIVNPQRRFALIESVGKKARFVQSAVGVLGCANVEVVHGRAEGYHPAQLFDTVAARALSSLQEFVAQAGHLCAPGGVLLAMKGRRPDAELAALPRGWRVDAVERARVPGLQDERHIVEIVKNRE